MQKGQKAQPKYVKFCRQCLRSDCFVCVVIDSQWQCGNRACLVKHLANRLCVVNHYANTESAKSITKLSTTPPTRLVNNYITMSA